MIPRGYAKPVRGLTFALHLAPGMPTPRGSVRSAGLPLRQARLCLDCDCLTDEQSCPWCDRRDTIPLSGWFHPIEDAQGQRGASRQDERGRPPAMDPGRPAPSAGPPSRPAPGAGRDRRGGRVRAPRRPAPPHRRRTARRGAPGPGSPAASAERGRLPGSRGAEQAREPAPAEREPRDDRGRPAAPPPARFGLADSRAPSPAQTVPQTSRATERTSSSFRRWSSGVIGWPPPAAELNPH